MSAERWLPVVGYEGLYEVSDLGRVRSLPRISTGKHQHRVPGKIRPQSTKPGTGYLSISLTREGSSATWNVHRLVAEAFIGPRPDGMDTCHFDGDKTNNAASNLRYDTRGNNLRDSVRHNTHRWSTVTHCPAGHPYSEENTRIQRSKSGNHRRCKECERRKRAAKKAADAIETRALRAA